MISNKLKIYASIILLLLVIFGAPLLLFKNFMVEKEVKTSMNVEKLNKKENLSYIDSIIKYKLPINKQIESINKNIDINLEFELPINGASGYASVDMDLKGYNSLDSKTITTINKGESFTIISEDNNWWYINYNEKEGWIENTFCMINLPDIIPSIIYYDSNSYKSMFKSSGYELQNITNKKLYDVLMYNDRLERNEFVMPVLYQMAKKIYKAQQLALKNGDSLKIYETFRPYEVQMKVSNTLKALATNNEDVYDGINSDVWKENWFISSSVSSHQFGIAIDTSLVKVNDYIIKTMGEFKYIEIVDYREYDMPTSMHELSSKSAVFTYGAKSDSKTDWKNAPFTSTITEGAIKLQNYCTDADLTPLASEWWHFNDLDAKNTVKGSKSNGDYYLSKNVSEKVE